MYMMIDALFVQWLSTFNISSVWCRCQHMLSYSSSRSSFISLSLSLILQKTFSIYLNIDHIRRLIYFHLNVNHLRFPCNREMYSIFIRNVMNVFRFRFLPLPLPLPLPLHCIRISIQQNIHFYSILMVFFSIKTSGFILMWITYLSSFASTPCKWFLLLNTHTLLSFFLFEKFSRLRLFFFFFFSPFSNTSHRYSNGKVFVLPIYYLKTTS